MLPGFIEKDKLPHKSGIYQFKSSQGHILYVGKAIDLYSRVASYFAKQKQSHGLYFNRNVDTKTQALVSEISSVETIIVESELEALILEANLIKKNHPPFNIRLMDDKDFLYIGLTREDFPRVVTIRLKDLPIMKKYWGPFPSSSTVRNTLKLLRRVFPWCSGGKKACFYYHLGLCPGSCVGLLSKREYQQIVNRFSKFLDGKIDKLIEELSKEMMRLAETQQFEQAAKLKKIIDGINYLTQPNRVQAYLENPNFLEEETSLALQQLQKDLNLGKIPERIEGYDISNIQGTHAVGSMVVLTEGGIDKSQYRRFKIKIAGKPNDVGMMREMINRRLKHPEWPLPDLIIIDGGRAQARAVKLEIPVFGLAKRMEWLYPSAGEVIKLPKKSSSLRLLQKLRDESHRFAISYHRKLRDRIR